MYTNRPPAREPRESKQSSRLIFRYEIADAGAGEHCQDISISMYISVPGILPIGLGEVKTNLKKVIIFYVSVCKSNPRYDIIPPTIVTRVSVGGDGHVPVDRFSGDQREISSSTVLTVLVHRPLSDIV